jgi:hypothetical protein
MLHELEGPAGPTSKVFREQLRFLTDHATVVRLEAFAEAPEAEDPTVAITFDDGDRRTCELAAGLLSDARVPRPSSFPRGSFGSTFPVELRATGAHRCGRGR